MVNEPIGYCNGLRSPPVELAEYRKLAHFLEKLTKAKLKELGETKGWKEIEI